MNKYILPFIIALFFQEPDQLVGNWKIQSYDAIDNIKKSPAYLFGDETARELIDEKFEAILTAGFYNFGADTLIYTDIEGTNLVTRRALWTIEKEILTVNEIDRPYKRKAFIHMLSADSLSISPIIDGEVVESKISFSRQD